MNNAFIVTFLAFCALQPTPFAWSEEAATKPDERYSFRTDFANSHLPWYAPKPLEFPPHHSDHRVSGELVSADFVHRTGQFRMTKTGALVDFTMPPYGAINYLNAEADLRDVPLGTFFLFFLNQDAEGGFTKLATMQDQFTMDAGHSFSYRLDEVKLDAGKLITTKHILPKKQDNLGKKEWLVTAETRVWKNDKLGQLKDLKIGDELLFNLTGKTATSPGLCSDVWVGADTHKLATEQQQAKFNAFTKHRGLPGWIEKTEDHQVTVTLFSGDTKNFKQAWMEDIAVGKDIKLAVANDELRTWNPPVDGERGSVLEVQKVPTECYGCSGVRVVVKVSNMLEGFRKGRVVRVFFGSWPVKDEFYGESLMGYGYGRMLNEELLENPAKEYPEQFPFRTDFSNSHLPWFKLQPGQVPPPYSAHLVHGELVKADELGGQLRKDGSGDLVSLTMIETGKVRYLNAEAKLADIPLGTRCRFSLYQDDKDNFAHASRVTDEFSHLAETVVTFRVIELQLSKGKIRVGHQIPEVKNYNGDMERIPDIARSELLVNDRTRVWKGDQQVKLSDLAKDDVLLANFSGELPDRHSFCTDIWIGAETHKLVTEKFSKQHPNKK